MLPQDFPLCWPEGRPRTAPEDRVHGRFTVDFRVAYNQLLDEAERLHDHADLDVVISTAVPVSRKTGLPIVSASRVTDPGVALYVWRGGKVYAVACDTYLDVRGNLRAVWSTVLSLRAIRRHGTTALLDQSMAGHAIDLATAEVPIGRRLAARVR